MNLDRSLAFGVLIPLLLVACGGGVAPIPDDNVSGGAGGGASGSGGSGQAASGGITPGSPGASGTSGSSGTSGASGTSGSSGTSGASGTSGSSGTSGASGTSGSSGTSGTSGTSGSSGSSGAPPAAPPFVVAPSELTLGGTGGFNGATGTYTATIDATTTVDGANAELLAASADASPNAWAQTYGVRPIDSSYWGKRYRMQAKVKTENTAYASIYFQIDTPPAGYVLDNMMSPTDRSLKGTNDWQVISLVLDVPTGAVDFSFGSELAGPGKIWVGPITFEEVAKTVPTTPHSFGGTSP